MLLQQIDVRFNSLTQQNDLESTDQVRPLALVVRRSRRLDRFFSSVCLPASTAEGLLDDSYYSARYYGSTSGVLVVVIARPQFFNS